jgi:predicted GNAT family acetyltransferase
MDLSVIDNEAKQRFEVLADGDLAGYAQYQLRGRRITVFHTEIDPKFEGHGVGSALARGLLDSVKARRLDLHPTCPFIAAYVRSHADEYLDLVPEAMRPRLLKDA